MASSTKRMGGDSMNSRWAAYDQLSNNESEFATSGVGFSSDAVYMSRSSSEASGPDATELSGLKIADLVNHLHNGSLEERRTAARDIRRLARDDNRARVEIAEAGAINPLIRLLSSDDSKTVERAAAAIHNLSIEESIKSLLVDSLVVDPLVHVLIRGSPRAKEAAASTLASLAMVNENKIVIGVLGGIPPLVHLLSEAHPEGRRDALIALFLLSIYNGNKKKIVKADAIPSLVRIVEDLTPDLTDRAMQLLGQLATIPEGRESIAMSDGIPVMVDILEEGSERSKEEAAAVLLLLCQNSSLDLVTALNAGPLPPLNSLSHAGTSRGRHKAHELLKILREYILRTGYGNKNRKE